MAILEHNREPEIMQLRSWEHISEPEFPAIAHAAIKCKNSGGKGVFVMHGPCGLGIRTTLRMARAYCPELTCLRFSGRYEKKDEKKMLFDLQDGDVMLLGFNTGENGDGLLDALQRHFGDQLHVSKNNQEWSKS